MYHVGFFGAKAPVRLASVKVTCHMLTPKSLETAKSCKKLLYVHLGRAEKWKNDILKYSDVDYDGHLYIKQGSFEKKIAFSKF